MGRIGGKAYRIPAVSDGAREALRLGVSPPFGEIVVVAGARQRGLPNGRKLTQLSIDALLGRCGKRIYDSA